MPLIARIRRWSAGQIMLTGILCATAIAALSYVGWNARKNGIREQRCLKDLPTVQGFSADWLGRVTGVHLNKANAEQVRQLAECNLASLKLLQLTECTLSDDDLALLQRFPHVVDLSLWGTPVGDASLTHLEPLERLLQLDVTATRITFTGVQRLRAKLPKTNIDANAPAAP